MVCFIDDLLADAPGNLARIKLLPGQRSEIVGVPDLIDGLSFKAMIADKAFDADHLRVTLAGQGATVIIPARCNQRLAHLHACAI